MCATNPQVEMAPFVHIYILKHKFIVLNIMLENVLGHVMLELIGFKSVVFRN
jgi:hypothetical protein